MADEKTKRVGIYPARWPREWKESRAISVDQRRAGYAAARVIEGTSMVNDGAQDHGLRFVDRNGDGYGLPAIGGRSPGAIRWAYVGSNAELSGRGTWPREA